VAAGRVPRAGSALSFWRTRAGSEIDFVLYGPDLFWALEVEHAQRVRPADLRSLKRFARDYPEARTRLAYLGDERLQIEDILCLPVAELLRTIVPGTPLP